MFPSFRRSRINQTLSTSLQIRCDSNPSFEEEEEEEEDDDDEEEEEEEEKEEEHEEIREEKNREEKKKREEETRREDEQNEKRKNNKYKKDNKQQQKQEETRDSIERQRLFTTCKHINNIQHNMFICSGGLPEGPEPIKARHPLHQTT